MTRQTTFLSAAALAMAVAPAFAQPTPAVGALETAEIAPRSTPLSVALAALDAPEIVAFYADRADQPAWTDAALAALFEAFAAAGDHGLPAARYDIEALTALYAEGGPDAEIALTEAYLQYANDLTAGVVRPGSVSGTIFVERPFRPAGELLAVLNGDVAAGLASLVPSHPHYQALVAEKARLESLMASGGYGAPIPDGPSLRPGDQGPRIVALRARLTAMGYGALGDSDLYDDALVDVVKQAQRDHGLNDDGVPGPATLGVLNQSPEGRLRQVLVNLERQRWLNVPERGTRHILVNIADQTARVYDNGVETFFTRTIVGDFGHETPEFYDEMEHLVVNPTWNVPTSISAREFLPRLRRDPGYLQRRNMTLRTRGGQAINPYLVNWANYSEGNFPFYIRQAPNLNNALGQVKFMFPNSHAIYLHDTPAKSLFNRDRRAFSHGCIRIHRPYELAAHLLAAQVEDGMATFQSLRAGGNERYVNLDAHVPIYLAYQTVWIAEDGTPEYRHDIYGRDSAVWSRLEAAGVTLGGVS